MAHIISELLRNYMVLNNHYELGFEYSNLVFDFENDFRGNYNSKYSISTNFKGLQIQNYFK